ncbi:hypothetical protein L2735_18095 [Shewanella olleyana]|uniref:hypothetical protein n=1 Tax=Shewanella olleyana TaxID=135626 RepID=UPI00200EA8D4|nr:hypothetical protein [Shewanella olleyana]MCL1068685.1 hypothetical protein [Shewanella olleyana]
MSVSSYNLTLVLSHHDLQITVYNGFGDVIAMMSDDPRLDRETNNPVLGIDSFRGTITLSLPRGIYQVEGKLGGQIQSATVRLNENKSIQAPQPNVYSAVPLSGAVTSHEYYEEAASSLSKGTSTIDENKPNLFLMIRTINQEQAQPINAYFRVLNESKNVVFDSRVQPATKSDSQGWMGFSLALSEGGYIVELIEDSPIQQRAIPIWLTECFQTQIFGLYTKGQIAYDSIRILMANRLLGFTPQAASLASIEIMTTSLIAGTRGLSGQSMRLALSGKFENPLVGLFAAHTLLRRETLNKDLLLIVIQNLERLLKASPDVKSLKVMLKIRSGEGISETKFSFPPTLRASYLGIIDADSRNSPVVEKSSLFEKIGVGICTDSPFVTWDISQLDRPEESIEWVKKSIVTSIAAFASLPGTPIPAIGELSKAMGITQNLLQSAALNVLNEAGQQTAEGESAFDFMNHHLPSYDDNRWEILKNLDIELSADETYKLMSSNIHIEK